MVAMRPILPGLRTALERAYLDAMVFAVRWGDRIVGPGALFWLTLPWTLFEIARRGRDYRYFLRLRKTLPDSFWGGTRAPRHFLRMIAHWQGTLCACLLYDRLRTPRWRKRIRWEGTPPDSLPEWGKRPVVLVFLHTGGFGMLRCWLRSTGIPAASFAIGQPPTMERPASGRALRAGDRVYGLEECPYLFPPARLRETIRFLSPGRILAVALDGIATPGPLTGYPVGAQTLHVKDGACRLAARSSALLIPVTVSQAGFSRFVVKFGDPVPDAWVRDADPQLAHRELLRQLWPRVQADPCSLTWSTLESLAPGEKRPRTGWP
jgi:lauroyl/myristoyl acyltransferase